MNVEMVKMHPAEAQAHLEEYERELEIAHDAELEAVARGYRALAEGTPVINLSRAINGGGHDEIGRPNLAVARADRQSVGVFSSRTWTGRCSTYHRARGTLIFDSYHQHRPPREYDGLLTIEVRVGWTIQRDALGHVTDVPVIPPAARRACGGKTKLRDHLVLWEVEEWRGPGGFAPEPPRDPFLLRPLGRGLFSVVAAWDLTEMERAVLASRVTA